MGDSVLLSTEHLKMQGADKRTPKFAAKFIGPFVVKRVVNDNAYELDLPPQLQIHPVLNISRLKAYRDGRVDFPAAPADQHPPTTESTRRADGAEEYEVDSVLAKRGSRRAHAVPRPLAWMAGVGGDVGAPSEPQWRSSRHRRLRGGTPAGASAQRRHRRSDRFAAPTASLTQRRLEQSPRRCSSTSSAMTTTMAVTVTTTTTTTHDDGNSNDNDGDMVTA